MRLKIFFTIFLVYLFYIAPGYITANTNRYIDLAKSIVENGTFNIDKYHANTRDRGLFNGHYYIGAAPGIGFAAVPLYAAFKPVLNKIPTAVYDGLEFSILNFIFSFFLAVLPGAILSALLYNILGDFELKEKERTLIVFGAAFGTNLFYYSTRFMAPVMGTSLLFGAFYITWKSVRVSMPKYIPFVLGLLLGAAVLTDYMLAIGSALILIYYISGLKKNMAGRLFLLFLGLFIMALIYAYYHYTCFKNPFAMATSYSQMIGPNPISAPKPKVMFELTFGAYRGLFTYMPLTLLSAYGLFIFFKNPDRRYLKEMILIGIFSLSVFLIISGFTAWDGGGDFGPRYFVCFIPFLMIPAAFVLRKLSYKMILWITALSVLINWCGVQYGDADNAFTNVGLFILGGLNSDLAQLAYQVTNTYIRKMNVLVRFSPFIGFVMLLFILCQIWKEEIKKWHWAT